MSNFCSSQPIASTAPPAGITPRACPVGITACPTRCCPMTLATPKTFLVLDPYISDKTWVYYQCSTQNPSSCSIKNYCFYIEGSFFSGGNVRLQVWQDNHVFLDPAKLMGAMTAQDLSRVSTRSSCSMSSACSGGGFRP